MNRCQQAAVLRLCFSITHVIARSEATWQSVSPSSMYALHTSLRLPKGETDCHTSDVGHWFAMTEVAWSNTVSAL
jgi:hypothetical protein